MKRLDRALQNGLLDQITYSDRNIALRQQMHLALTDDRFYNSESVSVSF